MSGSLPAHYFDALYAADPDPWRFATSDYERAKYAATLAALPPHCGRAFELGCSIGVLTRQLAPRCDHLLAVDIAQAALDQARRRCADVPNVAFATMQAPRDWPPGPFDLILLSEVLYYLDAADIDATAARVRATLGLAGVVLAVHWLGATNYPTTGDAAVERFIAATRLAVRQSTRTADYRLDLLQA